MRKADSNNKKSTVLRLKRSMSDPGPVYKLLYGLGQFNFTYESFRVIG